MTMSRTAPPLPLFEYDPMARRTDPESSHAAADWFETFGPKASQEELITALVCRYPGRTAQELEQLCGKRLSNVEIHRRSSGLRKRDLVETRVEDGAVHWYPGSEAEAFLRGVRAHGSVEVARRSNYLGGATAETAFGPDSPSGAQGC